MRGRSLLLALAVLLVADHAAATSKHEQTRRSAGKKGQKSRSSHHDHHDGGDGDFVGSCLGAFFSGCLSTGCDVAGQVAADIVADEAAGPAEPAVPPAPGLEGPSDRWEYEPLPPEDAGGALPEHLVPEDDPFARADPAAGEEAPPPGWMPDRPVSPAELREDEGSPAVAARRIPVTPEATDPDSGGPAGAAAGFPVTPEATEPNDGTARPGALAATDREVPAPATELDDPATKLDDFAMEDFRDSPEAFGVTAAAAPPRLPPPPDSHAEVDLRATGSWIVADLPNASFDARAVVRTRDPGPGLEVWYTGLWERIDERWDHLPVGGVRLAFGFGSAAVRPELRLGGALLGLGDGDNRFGFDAGLGLELRTGGEESPRIDLHEDVLVFEGLTAHDFGAGVSFVDGPVYVRVGLRALYLGTFYAGPELALGLRL